MSRCQNLGMTSIEQSSIIVRNTLLISEWTNVHHRYCQARIICLHSLPGIYATKPIVLMHVSTALLQLSP